MRTLRRPTARHGMPSHQGVTPFRAKKIRQRHSAFSLFPPRNVKARMSDPRGYGYSHQLRRKRMDCVRCEKPILPDEPWDLALRRDYTRDGQGRGGEIRGGGN